MPRFAREIDLGRRELELVAHLWLRRLDDDRMDLVRAVEGCRHLVVHEARVGEPRAVRHFHEPRLRAGLGAPPTSDVQGHYLYVTLAETSANVWLIDPRR